MDILNRNLMRQYFDLIREQQQIIRSLGSNVALINARSSEIMIRYINEQYRENNRESVQQTPRLSRGRQRRNERFPSRNRRSAMHEYYLPPTTRVSLNESNLNPIHEDNLPVRTPRRLPERPPNTPPPPPPSPLSPALRSNSRLRRRRRHQGDAPSTPTRLLPPLIPNILPPPPPTSEVSTMTEQTSRTVIPPDTGVEVPLETPQASRSRLRRRTTRFINPTAAETFPTMEEFNSPVRIRPSRHQISEATELILYSDLSDNYQTICPIDQQELNSNDYVLRIRHCGHIFREMNLRRHFRSSPRCPICRFDIRDYNTSVTDTLTNQIVNSINHIFNNAADSITRYPPGTAAEVTFTATLDDPSNNNLSIHLFGDV